MSSSCGVTERARSPLGSAFVRTIAGACAESSAAMVGCRRPSGAAFRRVAFVNLQIDNFATALKTPAFDRNPIGVEYDPDDLAKRFNAGVPVAQLVLRD